MILGFATVRNEATRLPHFLQHHRALGVEHFLIVDNASDDGTADYLAAQPDVSLWHSADSYKLARFGMDWLTLLHLRWGHGHWCLTLDADELLVYPDCDSRNLRALTGWLEARGRQSFGTIMLDLYPQGPVGAQSYRPGQDPTEVLQWFDAGNYLFKYQPDLQNLLVRGGVRYRKFFSSLPDRAPTLSKTPLVNWNRRYVYVSSTHSLLPPRLNAVRGRQVGDAPTGILLHTKFLPEVVAKSGQEKYRKEHFENSDLYETYYEKLMTGPTLWCPESVHFQGTAQLEELGLMRRGAW